MSSWRVRAATAVPTADPAPTPVTTTVGASSGFSGLDVADSRFADHGNQETFEPPDQGLCASNGLVLEIVNRAVLAVYSDQGSVIVAPVAMNAFFGFPPIINRQVDPPVFGPVLTDPQCYYDPQIGRWFLTIAAVATDPATGEFTGESTVALAVSLTSDPTSTWARYGLTTTDVGQGGAPSDPGCPCVADQPFVGADANGFYITSNEFAFGSGQFNGAQIYAMSKRRLAQAGAGGALPTVVHIQAGMAGGDYSVAIRPATTPPGGTYASNTEYFLSDDDFMAADNRLFAWALHHSDRLDDATPAVTLESSIVATEPFTQPPNVDQKPGPAPLGSSVGEPLNQIETDDFRVQQVQYSRGRLFTALATGLANGRVGAAWFVVNPGSPFGPLAPVVERQGYVTVAGDSVIYPTVAVTAAGRGVIAVGLAGPDYYPSAAFVAIDLHGVHGPVRVIGAGSGPEDGFSCYHAFSGSAADFGCPWGDYSAAVAEDESTIITGSEYIPSRPRTPFANWGTFIGRVHP